MDKRNLDTVAKYQSDHAVIRGKPFLKRLYSDFYAEILAALPRDVDGAVIEVGSGAGFFKEAFPELITGDIVPTGMSDLCFDAGRMPFRSGTLRGILMLDVFHHIPEPAAFLEEAARCLKPGGAIVMIEPWPTCISYPILKLLHHEKTDPRQQGWNFVSTGPLSGANQALPWIVFQRDRRHFEDRFPLIGIQDISLHTPFCYLLSGGLSHRQALPGSWYPAVRRIENGLRPLRRWLAMFATIRLARRAQGAAVRGEKADGQT